MGFTRLGTCLHVLKTGFWVRSFWRLLWPWLLVRSLPPTDAKTVHLACLCTLMQLQNSPPPSFMLSPQSALFLAIDLHCLLQTMDSAAHTSLGVEDEVVYYVNRDFSGWVEQRVKRRVYIELKMECTRNRKRDVQKARDDWVCLYCNASFPSKLRLTDHRVVGCPCGPVDSTGCRWELPVYPNLKTAKQGKDLKLALHRGDGSVWESLQDNSIWLDLNPELREPTFPPPGAKVQQRRFMEPTIDRLTACQATGGGSAPCKPRPERPPKPRSAPAAATEFVDLQDSPDDDPPIPQPNKRSHAQMEEGHKVYHSRRQFKPMQKKTNVEPSRPSGGGERQKANIARSSRPSPGPPPQPLRVKPIQTRSPSPERGAILAPPTPVPHVPPPPPMPAATPIPRNDTSSGENDVVARLRHDRQAFYLKAASAARASVKMDIPKPPLRPPVQPPGLFHLLQCGLLEFDLESGSFPAFQEEVDNWRNDPRFMDRLFAAYGRFHASMDQVPHLIIPALNCVFGVIHVLNSMS